MAKDDDPDTVRREFGDDRVPVERDVLAQRIALRQS